MEEIQEYQHIYLIYFEDYLLQTTSFYILKPYRKEAKVLKKKNYKEVACNELKIFWVSNKIIKCKDAWSIQWNSSQLMRLWKELAPQKFRLAGIRTLTFAIKQQCSTLTNVCRIL